MSSSSKLRFDEILKLVEYIPITGSLPSNGRFAKNITIDSLFYFESLKELVWIKRAKRFMLQTLEIVRYNFLNASSNYKLHYKKIKINRYIRTIDKVRSLNNINQRSWCIYIITIMSIDITKRVFIKYVLAILAVVIAYFIGALLIIDYFPR